MTVNAPISVREIEMQARSRCEALVRELLPNALKDGNYLKIGSVGGEKGSSLVINTGGSNRGLWRDWSAGGLTGAQGDMIGLVETVMFGGDRGKAVQWLKSWLGLDDLDPARLGAVRAQAAAADADAEATAEREAEAKKRGARALWLNGVALNGDCPASRYLAGRGICVARPEGGGLGKWPGSLRFHSEVWNRDAGTKLPAMLATMVTPDGVQVATHRTWLARDAQGRWGKADGGNVGVPRGNAKKVLGKSGGAFVPLRKGASGKSMADIKRGETIYLTEGIEDALTVAMAMPAARVGAAYSLGNMGAIAFPPAIETIVMVCDRDEGVQAQQLLERAIARQQARGHRVKIVMPPVGHKDINAWLLASAQVAA